MQKKNILSTNHIEELASHDAIKLKTPVSEVAWHELGHHLGFSEKEIRAFEAKRGK